MLLSYNLLKTEIYSIFTWPMGAIKTIAFCIFICFIPMMGQSITVNDTYCTKILLIYLQTVLAPLHQLSVSGHLFRDSESYGSFRNEQFPFPRRILLSTWVSVRRLDLLTWQIGGGSISWKGDLDLEEVLGISNTFNATVLEFDFIPLTNFISLITFCLMNINLTFLANTQMVLPF
jgi:hypothetical protein